MVMGLFCMFNLPVAKWWRYRYRFNGTTKMLSMGVYPDVTLKEAHNQHVHFKELLVQGTDPSQHRQEQKINAMQIMLFVDWKLIFSLLSVESLSLS